jgi:pantothenate kinase
MLWQASVLQAWAGKEENFRAAVDVAGALAKYVQSLSSAQREFEKGWAE